MLDLCLTQPPPQISDAHVHPKSPAPEGLGKEKRLAIQIPRGSGGARSLKPGSPLEGPRRRRPSRAATEALRGAPPAAWVRTLGELSVAADSSGNIPHGAR